MWFAKGCGPRRSELTNIGRSLLCGCEGQSHLFNFIEFYVFLSAAVSASLFYFGSVRYITLLTYFG